MIDVWSFLFRLLYAVRDKLAPPPAPGRFDEMTKLFIAAFPHADRGQWEAHCAKLCASAYWEGEARGYDRARGLNEDQIRSKHDWAISDGCAGMKRMLARRQHPFDPLANLPEKQRKTILALAREGRLADLKIRDDE